MMSTCQTSIDIDSSRSTESTFSNTSTGSLCCRICHDGNSLEQLIHACDCSGSIGLVHPICLEKWLSQSARESCELCQYEFQTTKTVKNFYQVSKRTFDIWNWFFDGYCLHGENSRSWILRSGHVRNISHARGKRTSRMCMARNNFKRRAIKLK